MKPCGNCGFPIENNEAWCEDCAGTAPRDKLHVLAALPQPISNDIDNDEPFIVKIGLLLAGLSIQTAAITGGVVLACWVFVGGEMPATQSATIGLGIAIVFCLIDGITHRLNR